MEPKAKARDIRRINRRIEELGDWIEIEEEKKVVLEQQLQQVNSKSSNEQIREEIENINWLLRDYNYEIWCLEHERSIVESL